MCDVDCSQLLCLFMLRFCPQNGVSHCNPDWCGRVAEWMEFSPYDIGMPKYGTFMRPELFGCKFFMGQIVKRYPEPPLHFLQGQPSF